jgi:uncharacterized damage-inducible protein DinB
MSTPGIGTIRPGSGEYAEYYDSYISLVPDGDIVATLSNQLESTLALLRGIDESQANKRYEPDKWSIKELVGHMIDAERIFAYRALRFARNDQTPLSGFEQDDYVKGADFDGRSLADITNEFEHVRRSTISLFGSLSPEAYTRRGPANDVEVSVRALAYMMAGHEAHHMNILKTRYL